MMEHLAKDGQVHKSNMFKIKIADLVIQIENKYSFIENQCKDYIVTSDKADMVASCTNEEIEAEHTNYAEKDVFSLGYCESVCIYRSICLQMPEFDAFIFHSAVAEVDGKAYAFAARSGTGKSTHLLLWKEYLKDKMTIINGDKPIFRFIDGELFAYGTPWCGKEGWHVNSKAPLKAICFIERALENRIASIPKSNAADLVMKQVIIPKDPFGAIKTLELLDKMLAKTDTWLLGCNISVDAARLSYNTMAGVQNED